MTDSTPLPFVEDVEVGGHVIDAFILPKVLDLITSHGGAFKIKEITIGQQRTDPSYALIEVSAGSAEKLADVLAQIVDHGAVPVEQNDCRLVDADLDGCFPEAFYSTTNQRTEVRIDGKWVPVADQEMDCGVVVEDGRPRCIPMTDVRRGQLMIV
ncbi:MAG TPA: TIGR00300 family protein, partial [Pirellulales bacterium]